LKNAAILRERAPLAERYHRQQGSSLLAQVQAVPPPSLPNAQALLAQESMGRPLICVSHSAPELLPIGIFSELFKNPLSPKV
jgi:hypothetical protein